MIPTPGSPGSCRADGGLTVSLHPSVAAVRHAVRRGLADLDPGARLVVACSGGADSLALASATVFEGRDQGWYVVGATVDHGLQEDSDARADAVVAQLATLGVDETVGARARVEAPGLGPEAAARAARYAVLEQIRESFDADVVLLGHTRDDQAETVLLGLARGAARSPACAGPSRPTVVRSSTSPTPTP
jgi:tRNA(Ile)-lysidine synthase